MTPPELLLASLATCAGYYAVQYLKTRKLETEGLQVRISAGKAQAPARLDQFHIDVDVPMLNDATHLDGVRRSVEKCLIKNTLLTTPSITVDVKAAVEAAR